MSTRNHRTLTFLLLALTAVLSQCNGCPPTGPTPFSDIVADNSQAYENYMMKLSYLGLQLDFVSTMVFGSADTLSVTPFTPFRRSSVEYINDDLDEIITFSTTGAEMEAIVTALQGDATLTNPNDNPDALLSFMIMRDVGGPNETVFETLVGIGDSGRLLNSFIIPNLAPGNALGLELCQFWSKNVGG